MCPPPETRTAMSGMRHSLSTAMAELKVFLLSLAPRPYDVPCAHIMKSDYVCNECPKTQGIWLHKCFWHNRLQCNSSQRSASVAAGSESAADAAGRHLDA
jgi:hypothetical protein